MPRLTMQEQIFRRYERHGRIKRLERHLQRFDQLIGTPHPPVKGRPAKQVFKR